MTDQSNKIPKKGNWRINLRTQSSRGTAILVEFLYHRSTHFSHLNLAECSQIGRKKPEEINGWEMELETQSLRVIQEPRHNK